MSIDPGSKDQGGALGWLPRGMLDGTLDRALFECPTGQSSQPFQNSQGWHIQQVLEHEDARPLTDAQRELLGQRAFRNWVDDQRDDNPDITQNLTVDARNWALRHIGVRPT